MLEPLPELPVETPLDAAPPRSGAKPAAAASPPRGFEDEEAALAFMDPELQLSPSQTTARAAQPAVVIPVPAAGRSNGGEPRSIDQSLEELDALPKAAAVIGSTRPELTLEEIDAAAQAAAAAPKSVPGSGPAPTLSPAPDPVLAPLTLEDRDVDRVLASGSPIVDLAPARAPIPPAVIPVPAPSGAAAAPAPATPATLTVPPAKTAPPAKTRSPAAAPAAPVRPDAPVPSS
ncbi:MAG: hypothetical protein WBE65_06385, partial [Steroidobacteraceae bacterium]